MVVVILLAQLQCQYASASPVEANARLDNDFINLSHQVYAELIKHNYSLPVYTNTRELKQAVAEKLQHNPAEAILAIVTNKALINTNIDDRNSIYFIQQLLQQNEWKAAEEMHQVLETDADKALLANADYYVGQYFYQRGDWEQCLHYLENSYDNLPDQDASYARLISGACYQELHQQRKALGIYQKIPETSPDYIYAQLNAAIVNFRQGWWSTARNIIENTLKNHHIVKNDEMLNRLNLVLGYALMQKEYYRDSREAFRNVELTSRYANRALLGIGLTAAYQDDYVDALNALNLLKEKKVYELSVDEAYLVTPTIIKKMGQSLTASAAYNAAIEFYQQRIDKLDGQLQDTNAVKQAQYASQSHQIVFGDTRIDVTEPDIWVLIDNRKRLKNILVMIKQDNISLSSKTQQRLKQLEQSFDQAMLDTVISKAMERLKMLKDYQSQAKYGLARLYDNTTRETGQ